MIRSTGVRLGAAMTLGLVTLQLTGCGGLDVTVKPDRAAPGVPIPIAALPEGPIASRL
jgi:hypothetical protein